MNVTFGIQTIDAQQQGLGEGMDDTGEIENQLVTFRFHGGAKRIHMLLVVDGNRPGFIEELWNIRELYPPQRIGCQR